MKLSNALRALPPSRHQEIRDAYYKAAEGLAALADALETADSELAAKGGTELLAEHYLAVRAREILDRSRLGAHV